MRKYPLYIGSISSHHLNRPDQKIPIGGEAASDCPLLGSVDVEHMCEGDPILAQMAAVCSQNGFALNDMHPGPYAVRDYTYGAGSVGPHTDKHMGPTLGVLVATKSLCRGLVEQMPSGFCYLTTKSGNLEVRLGDVFIFNADNEHSWISNFRWVLGIHSVRKLRKRK